MSPVPLAPVSTAYCSLSLAPPPVSVMYQPAGSVVFVVDPAVFESVTNFSAAGEPIVVRLTAPAPVSASAVRSTNRLRKLLDGNTNDRTTTNANSVATLVRTETNWFFSDMDFGASPKFLDCNSRKAEGCTAGAAGILSRWKFLLSEEHKRTELDFAT